MGGIRIKVPLPSNATDAPLSFHTVIIEQIGLKLEVAKVLVRLLAVDHVEHLSAN